MTFLQACLASCCAFQLASSQTDATATCDTQWCRDYATDCLAGTLTQPCPCEKGVARVLDKPSGPAGNSQRYYRYTCCKEHELHNTSIPRAAPSRPARFTFDRDGCGDYSSTHMRASSILALTLCVVGAMLCAGGWRCILNDGRRIERGADHDTSEISTAVVDGDQLHHSVPPQNWCVTREDLRQFRRLVRRAVLDGHIQPTEECQFDPTENKVGPSIYNVCDQYVAPVTARAGNPSWALLLHPEGLECDLFISHSWHEGVYEFIDKVVHSWPTGKRHAYVCFLSNPQNLSIASFISSPSDSPFARALGSATDVMVVSNRTVSNYARIWCTYEAYLAYTLDKRIFCASSPVHGFWPRVVSQLGVCVVGLGIGAAGWLLCVFCAVEHFAMAVRNLLIGAMVITMVANTVLLQAPTSIACRRSCSMAAHLSAGVVGAVLQMDYTFPVIWAGVLILIAFGMCLEADRLWAAEAVQEKNNLSSGYTGHVNDARCSVLEDGERILQEIGEHVVAVDLCVEVLIRTGLSTSHLRSAAERAGRLGNASNWSTASVVSLAGAIWVWLPAHAVAVGHECTFDNGATAYLCILQGMLWSALFAFAVSSDRKAFAAKSLLTMLICLAMRAIDACGMLLMNALVIGPFVLTLTLAGPANVARIPLVGPMLVHLFLGVWDIRNPCARRQRRFSIELWQGSATAQVYGKPGDDADADVASPVKRAALPTP